ncbi:MAG: 30S ribosomal protein S2 [Candidatus Pacebacteria bacterium]|nr:30S ribosomal protein S2 [Candidatus Paceibacterota bacterium]
MTEKVQDNKTLIDEMFTAGVHYGYSRSRRHPSMKKAVYGVKNNMEIIDLEKTIISLAEAEEFITSLAKEGKKLLMVGSKNQARSIIEEKAESIGASFVNNRWIGGTLTNFEEIKKRLLRLQELTDKKEKGELGMYTKKERVMIDREIGGLEKKFGGLLSMINVLPSAIFVIDPKAENIAVSEARATGLPVIAVANSDCDISDIDHPIAANDSSRASIQFFTEHIVEAYKRGLGSKK